MKAELISGKTMSEEIRRKIAERVEELRGRKIWIRSNKS